MTVSGRVATALLSVGLAMTVLDRAIAFFDLDYAPTRGRPNDASRIEHALATMPGSQLDGLRPVLEGMVVAARRRGREALHGSLLSTFWAFTAPAVHAILR